MKIQSHQHDAVTWMEQHDLASINSSGRFVLHSSALTFSMSLSNVQRVQEPENPLECSIWSLRRRLKRHGWREGKSGKHASVEAKRFNPQSQFVAYYAILLSRFWAQFVDYFVEFCWPCLNKYSKTKFIQ